MLNFETKVQQRLSLYAFKLTLTNIQSENIALTKVPLFPLKDGQTVLAQPTERWAALLLSMKKWFTHSKKKLCCAEL